MPSDRETAFAVWLTGLPASGKSTVARALAAELGGKGIRAAVLESDAVRREIAPNAGYGDAERDAFYATACVHRPGARPARRPRDRRRDGEPQGVP